MITEKGVLQKEIESGRDILQWRRERAARKPEGSGARLRTGRVESKGEGEVFRERMCGGGIVIFCARRVRRQERDDAHGHVWRAEFGEHLAAGAARVGGRFGGTSANDECEEIPFSFGDRLEEGGSFGAVGQAVRGIFDVYAGPD